MDEYRCKTPVVMIFFNRPDTLKLVFEQVRKAKPMHLYLVQDGPREGCEDDLQNIRACREIVENIDWECIVHKNYSETNLGCGMRPQTGISWALSQEERIIILEDDCVPDPSFFPYCEEVLERYKEDQRISYISGLNHFETWDFGKSSYGFTKSGAIWGWATWRRAWEKYDYSVNQINDPYIRKQLDYLGLHKRVLSWEKTYIATTRGDKISYWDNQWGFVKYSQHQLVIVPKFNLINNIGVGVASTHAQIMDSKHVKYVDYNNMPVKSLEFPLVHPSSVIQDKIYDDLFAKCVKRVRYRWPTVRRKLYSIVKGKG